MSIGVKLKATCTETIFTIKMKVACKMIYIYIYMFSFFNSFFISSGPPEVRLDSSGGDVLLWSVTYLIACWSLSVGG